MAEVIACPDGGYRFIKGVFQYSAGVAAEPGFEVVRVRLSSPVPLANGFALLKRHIESAGRPIAALCACELRSPKPFDDAGFLAFNKQYIVPLQNWGIVKDGLNPIARSNVCPAVNPPAQPSLYAFSYTAPSRERAPTFVIAGSGEAQEGSGPYSERTIRLGDRSAEGIRDKARWVLGEMERRMGALGVSWRDATATQLYTVYEIHHLIADEIAGRGAADAGLTWHFCRPPVDVIDYEMDVRGVYQEFVLPASADS